MAILYAFCLRLIHAVYSLYLLLLSYRERQQWRPPQPLNSERRRTPRHLAIVLETSPSHSKDSTKAALIQSVSNAAAWCREVGIQQLTVYEEHGLLSEYDQDIRFQLLQGNTNSAIDDSSESEVEPYHPLTPPPSDYSDSRPISPLQSSRPVIPSIRIVLSEGDGSKERSSRKGGLKRRNRNERTVQKSSLTLSLISKDASKNAIAVAATLMSRNAKLQRRKSRSRKPFTLTVNELEGLLEGEHGLSSPDFMIVHSLDVSNTRRKVPLELYNFPPWHIRLTEIHHSRLTLSAPYHASETCYSLDETVFREALDEFAGAEFRFGK